MTPLMAMHSKYVLQGVQSKNKCCPQWEQTDYYWAHRRRSCEPIIKQNNTVLILFSHILTFYFWSIILGIYLLGTDLFYDTYIHILVRAKCVRRCACHTGPNFSYGLLSYRKNMISKKIKFCVPPYPPKGVLVRNMDKISKHLGTHSSLQNKKRYVEAENGPDLKIIGQGLVMDSYGSEILYGLLNNINM